MDERFWAGRRVFVTGHTGFKGSWLSLWLQKLGAVVKGYALAPDTDPSLFEVARVGDEMESELGDIRDAERIARSLATFEPEILIHMAAQPLVRRSYRDPVETYAVNVMGTVQVLEAARALRSLRAIVSVTTDKCYDNKEWVWGYREGDPLGGKDPYSSSKACAELVSAAYRSSFFAANGVRVATARAGNVIGGGDWAEDRLIPDILAAFAEKRAVSIRNPAATRPWQHVLEPLSGYLALAEALVVKGDDYADAWNFGPRSEDARPVAWIAERLAQLQPGSDPWTKDRGAHPHEARQLKLDTSKACEQLCWKPRWSLDEALQRITAWDIAFRRGEDMRATCFADIADYTSIHI